jgi:hypothetical protein
MVVSQEQGFDSLMETGSGWMEKHCGVYAKHSEANDDMNVLARGLVAQLGDQSRFSNVGWGIWPDRDLRSLDQIDAGATSILVR